MRRTVLTTGRVPAYPVSYPVGYPGNEYPLTAALMMGLSFPTIFVTITRKSNFETLSPLYDLLELHNLYQSIALELLRNLRTILIGLPLTALDI